MDTVHIDLSGPYEASLGGWLGISDHVRGQRFKVDAAMRYEEKA